MYGPYKAEILGLVLLGFNAGNANQNMSDKAKITQKKNKRGTHFGRENTDNTFAADSFSCKFQNASFIFKGMLRLFLSHQNVTQISIQKNSTTYECTPFFCLR